MSEVHLKSVKWGGDDKLKWVEKIENSVINSPTIRDGRICSFRPLDSIWADGTIPISISEIIGAITIKFGLDMKLD